MGKLGGARFLGALVLAGACLFSASGIADAGQRLHDQAIHVGAAKAAQGQTAVSAGAGRLGIRDRIDALLHPKAEAPERTERGTTDYKLLPVDLDNEDILGGPMATEAQCVNYLLKINQDYFLDYKNRFKLEDLINDLKIKII